MITGVVLAGGASMRFGGTPKGLQLFRARAMALCVADVLSAICARVVIEASPGAGYEALGLPVIHADPAHAGNTHSIHAEGAFGEFRTQISARTLSAASTSSMIVAGSLARAVLAHEARIVV